MKKTTRILLGTLFLTACSPKSEVLQDVQDQAGDLIEMGKEVQQDIESAVEDAKDRIEEVQEGIDLIKEGADKLSGEEKKM